MNLELGRWHNVSSFVFCVGDCPFESKSTPTSADACGEESSCNAGHQEVGRCSAKGEFQGMYITFASTKANKAEPTMALKPREDVTRNLKQGYQWPQNRTYVYVRQKHF